ncbi:MAG: 50S ribosomal protein L10 [Anaerovoracaceae bacterium]|jgi:large subunit ribosomal protein L10
MASKEHLIEKQEVVEEIKEKLEKAQSAVVIDYMGIDVAQATAMRKKLREADIDYTVYKNTLLSRAIKGTEYEGLDSVLNGPTAIAFSYDDPVAPARILNGVIKDYKKMAFKGGVIEGQFYDSEGVKTIAALPSREELIAKFMGSIQSPVSKVVRTFQAIADAKEE